MKLLTTQCMQELDEITINTIKIPSIVLMENASQGASVFFSDFFPLQKYKNTIILVGKGNNGGDGIAVGRILAQAGYRIKFLFLTELEKLNQDPKINFRIIKNLNLDYTVIKEIKEFNNILNSYQQTDTFIVDAIFGTGLTKPIKPGLLNDIIQGVNKSGFLVGAIDIPSGISESFLPEENTHIKADCTATFQYLKLAHIYPDGNRFCGKIKVIDIGIPKTLIDPKKHYINLINPKIIKKFFVKRPIDSHKGHYGHCLTISGSIEKPGASILSSYATLKSGAGLCTAAVLKENRKINIQSFPELMELPYTDPDELKDKFNNFNALLIGPGLGISKKASSIVANAFDISLSPIILDADAINILANLKSLLNKKRTFPLILTPHPGEFSSLSGYSSKEILSKRIELSREYAIKHNLYLILKGHHTVTATPNGNIYLNQTGNPGMATAGSGDVLSGVICGFIAQFKDYYPMEEILNAAVFIHGYAGDLANQKIPEMSLTASDLISHIPDAIRKINDFRSNF